MMLQERRLGSISGPIVLRDGRGAHDLRASAWSGPTGPSSDGVSIVEHDARFMMLVEKDSIFARLREDEFAMKCGCVLLCGNGYPGRTFRVLLRQIHDQLRLPLYVLADNDPAGYELFFMTARGTVGGDGTSAAMAIPDAEYLGLRVRDHELLGLGNWVGIGLSDCEREQLLRLKSYPWLKSDAGWQQEFDALLQRGFKVEMEALCSVSPLCLAQRYLPERLAAGDFLRLPGANRL